MSRVYIAGPITNGCTVIDDKKIMPNIRKAMDAAWVLIDNGHNPFVPQLSYFMHKHRYPNAKSWADQKEWDMWLTNDHEWIRLCDCLLRLPGKSKGADNEIEFANRIEIPVYYSVKKLLSKES